MTTLFKACVVGVMIACATSACVSREAYQKKNDEVTNLTTRLHTLEDQILSYQRQVAQCQTDKTDLNSRLSELRQSAVDRQEDLDRARGDIARLESVLSARSEETGRVLNEMRQTIDRLQEENRALSDRLRREHETALPPGSPVR